MLPTMRMRSKLVMRKTVCQCPCRMPLSHCLSEAASGPAREERGEQGAGVAAQPEDVVTVSDEDDGANDYVGSL